MLEKLGWSTLWRTAAFAELSCHCATWVTYSWMIGLIMELNRNLLFYKPKCLWQVFQKFKSDSATNALDDRFRVFTEKIIPQYKDPAMTGVLIYIPSYFDYVRIRNYLKQSDYNFVQICEYSKVRVVPLNFWLHYLLPKNLFISGFESSQSTGYVLP